MVRAGGGARPGDAAGLEQMSASGLLTSEAGQYMYAPPTPSVERTIDRLAESYAKYRVAVISLIFSAPGEAVTRFSDAFRIRRADD